MGFCAGDRVRIKNPVSEYTGCRGTVMEDNTSQDNTSQDNTSRDDTSQQEGVLALGHFVAIDGENGRTRPFLVRDLERVVVARVRSRSVTTERARDAAVPSNAGSKLE